MANGPMRTHVPDGDGIYLDHLAHWVPDLRAAGDALEGMGFILTPTTAHSHAPAPGAPREPAGSSNRCIMLEQGYLEILTPTGQTPIGRELSAGIARYVGLHLAAFCVADAAAERERLVDAGFPQRPTVSLERVTRGEDGAPVPLRFTVIRPQPGTLAEGRIQFLTHHTPDRLWTPALTTHPNGITALTDLLICVGDPHEAGERYRRYLRHPATAMDGGVRFDLDRGSLSLLDPGHCLRVLGRSPPTLPWMAAYGLRCRDLASTTRYLEESGLSPVQGPGGSALLHLPGCLGGSIALHQDDALIWD